MVDSSCKFLAFVVAAIAKAKTINFITVVFDVSAIVFWFILIIIYNIHPMMMECRTWVYDFGLNTADKFNALDDVRRIIVNIVNHIDEITDAI